MFKTREGNSSYVKVMGLISQKELSSGQGHYSSQAAYDFADKVTPILRPKTTLLYPLCRSSSEVSLNEELKLRFKKKPKERKVTISRRTRGVAVILGQVKCTSDETVEARPGGPSRHRPCGGGSVQRGSRAGPTPGLLATGSPALLPPGRPQESAASVWVASGWMIHS